MFTVQPSAADELLRACDAILEATRAGIRLAQTRSTPLRIYSLGKSFALELDYERTLVFDPETRRLMLLHDVEQAQEQYDDPLVLFKVLPALAARVHGAPTADLNETEKRILVLLQRGHPNKEIALRLSLAESTVKNHLTQLYARFDAHSRLEMMVAIVALGLVPDSDATFDTVRAVA